MSPRHHHQGSLINDQGMGTHMPSPSATVKPLQVRHPNMGIVVSKQLSHCKYAIPTWVLWLTKNYDTMGYTLIRRDQVYKTKKGAPCIIRNIRIPIDILKEEKSWSKSTTWSIRMVVENHNLVRG